jgi:hypothetical protein
METSMARFFKVALIIAEMSSIPIAGCLIDFDSPQSDFTVKRLGVAHATASNEDINPRKFRFRIPRASELRDLIPKYKLPSSMAEARLTVGPYCQPSVA